MKFILFVNGFFIGMLTSTHYSASVDGRVFIWRISEGPDEEDKTQNQITWKIVIAIQIVGEGKAVHPRLCWHPHKQVMMDLLFL